MCCFDQSGEQYGIDAAFTCGYKGYALRQRQRKAVRTGGGKRKMRVLKFERSIDQHKRQREELLCE
jgi:hypothetical protein